MMSRMFFFLLFFSMYVGGKLSGEKNMEKQVQVAVKKEQKNDRFFPLHSNDNCRRRSSFCMHMEWSNLRQTHKKSRRGKN